MLDSYSSIVSECPGVDACSNHGTCVDTGDFGYYTCQCDEGFTGEYCNETISIRKYFIPWSYKHICSSMIIHWLHCVTNMCKQLHSHQCVTYATNHV